MPDFLEKVSFGLYAIVHPSDYDSNGNWIDKKKIIPSGLFNISKWDGDHFEIALRDDFSRLSDEKKLYNKIEFNFSLEPSTVLLSDIIFREKMNNLTNENDWSYASTTTDSNIVYVKVMKWNNVKSIYHDKHNRQILRNLFYKNLKSAGYSPTSSFFPLSISSVREPEQEINLDFPKFKLNTITSPPFFGPLKSKENQNKKDLGEIYKLGFENFCKELNVIPRYAKYPDLSSDEEKIFDIQFLGTGINIYHPIDDIKFMFLSKHGIQLPDENGEIRKLLESKNIDIQEINQAIWDQAIIWPIRHYSQGFWIKKESKINLSNLNLAMNPIDFQFVLRN